MIDLTPFLHHMPAWLMVLARLSGMFLLTPVLGSATVPVQVKALLVVGLAVCVYPVLMADAASAAVLAPAMTGGLSLWTLGPVLGLELLLGYVMGYLVMLPLAGLQTGGHIIGQQMGIGIGGVYNPELDGEAGVIGQFLFLLGLVVFLQLGGHHAVFAVLVGSFRHVPLGGFTDLAMVLEVAVGLVSVMMELAVRVAAPLMALLFLESVAMGFLARTVPQMNILSIGFALRILITSVVLIALIPVIGGLAEDGVVDAVRRMAGLVEHVEPGLWREAPPTPSGGGGF